MSLGAETARAALCALDKLKEQQSLEPADEHAVERLWSFLSRAQFDALACDAPDALDDTQRAYLLSFRNRSDSGRRQFLLQPSRPSALGDGGSGGAGGDPLVARNPTDDAELAALPALQEQLRALEDWERFDVFRVAQLTEGRPLRTVALHLLRRRGLVGRLGLPEDKLTSFLDETELLYPPNPYHNSSHAADVTQAVGAMLAAGTLPQQLSDLELLAVILAAAVHDLGHPGVGNDFLVATNSEAALQYNDRSINENMHLATAFRLLTKPDNNFISHLCEEDYRCFRSIVIDIVLATDMARHHGLVQEFAGELQLWGPDLSRWPADKRTLALQVLVHSADISSPARPWSLSSEWGRRVQDEFFLQGDRERELGLHVTLQCDRDRASVAQNQSAFIEYVMRPAYELLADIVPKFAGVVMPHINASLKFWQQQQQQAASPPLPPPEPAQQAAAGSRQQEQQQEQQKQQQRRRPPSRPNGALNASIGHDAGPER